MAFIFGGWGVAAQLREIGGMISGGVGEESKIVKNSVFLFTEILNKLDFSRPSRQERPPVTSLGDVALIMAGVNDAARAGSSI